MAIALQQLWLIVAGKNDQVAQSLTGELRMAGERAILVDTPETVQVYAATTAICIVVFSSNGPLPDVLSATSRVRFVAHIPIVDDIYREVPSGPWACEPIAVQNIDITMVAQLRERVHEIEADGANEKIESGLAEPPTLPLTKSERKSRRLKHLMITLNVLALIALLFQAATIWFGHGNNVAYTYQPPPTYPIGVGYSVHVPGTCDDTPTVSWELRGKNTTICSKDGVLMQRDNLQYSDMITFNPNEVDPKQYFGTIYTVQATMQFIKSDKTTCMGLDTFEQEGDNLGSVSFYVCGDGHWEVDLFNHDGTFYTALGIGVLTQPQTTYSMRISIQGAAMILQLNGTKVTTLTNPGFFTTSSVAIATTELSDSTIVSQILFSDFSVQPGITTQQ